MTIKPEYLKQFVNATEKAAYGAFKFIGKNDKISADQAAVDSMRSEFNRIDMDGKIVIGEGEMDEAPMLFIGENVGTKKGQKIDLAVDPLEGTNFVAKNLPNSFSVLAAAEENKLFFAPDTYMEKIAIGSNLPKNLLPDATLPPYGPYGSRICTAVDRFQSLHSLRERRASCYFVSMVHLP